MFDRFEPRARRVCSHARNVAQDLRQDYIGTQHFLLALIDEGGAASRMCAEAGLTRERVFPEIDALTRPLAHATFGQLPFSPRSKTLLEKTLDISQELRHDELTPEHLMVGLLRANAGLPSLYRRENITRKVLKRLDVDVAALEEQLLTELRALPTED